MNHGSLRVVEGGTSGLALLCGVPLSAGDVVFDLGSCTPVPEPDRYSIQIGIDRHVDAGAVRYLNHSCAPSTMIDTERLRVVALHDLAPGAELTFFYPSTEWDMAQPFPCLCGAPGCIGEVRGARYLDTAVLLREQTSPHVRELYRRTREDRATVRERAV